MEQTSHDRIRRAAVLFGLLGFIVCGGLGLSHYLQAEQWQRYVLENLNNLHARENDCPPNVADCAAYSFAEKNFQGAVAGRNSHMSYADIYAKLSVGIPLSAAILFFSYRWIWFGSVLFRRRPPT